MARDVGAATWDEEVVARSRDHAVVVDFWAAWCGPCHALAPQLEAAVDDREPDVELVKVDVDAEPELAARYGVQGIPAVKAFRDGRVVSEFVGVQPREQIDAFLDALAPDEAARLIAAGDEGSLRAAIDADPQRAQARVALARLLLARGEVLEARALLHGLEQDRVAAGLLARIELAGSDDVPDGVAEALAALDRGEVESALGALLQATVETGGETRDRLRRVMVGVFGELGDDHDLAVAYRRRLATALY
jgi:putative thioredoxin